MRCNPTMRCNPGPKTRKQQVQKYCDCFPFWVAKSHVFESTAVAAIGSHADTATAVLSVLSVVVLSPVHFAHVNYSAAVCEHSSTHALENVVLTTKGSSLEKRRRSTGRARGALVGVEPRTLLLACGSAFGLARTSGTRNNVVVVVACGFSLEDAPLALTGWPGCRDTGELAVRVVSLVRPGASAAAAGPGARRWSSPSA